MGQTAHLTWSSTLARHPRVPWDGKGHTQTISLESLSFFDVFLLLCWPEQAAMCTDDETRSTGPDVGRFHPTGCL